MVSEKRKGCLDELKDEFSAKKFGLSHRNPALFVTAECFGAPAYPIWSGFWALFFFSMLMLDIFYNEEEGAEYLVFLTNISYIFQTATVLLDFIVTVYVYIKRSDICDGKHDRMERYLQVQWIIFNIINTVSIMVTLLYYAIFLPCEQCGSPENIAERQEAFTHSSVNKHLLNSAYSILNILFCAKPVQILHFNQPMIYAIMYAIFTVIYHLAGANPVYDPLDWGEPGMTFLKGVLAICVGIPVVHIFVFYSLYTVRIFVAQTCCNSSIGPEPEVPISNDINNYENSRQLSASGELKY